MRTIDTYDDNLSAVRHGEFGPGEQPTAYLAGPMRGSVMHNFHAFFKAALALRASGWGIENPAEYDMAAGVNPAGVESDWPVKVKEMLRTDFLLILEKCNAIILLEGWEESTGAGMELSIAYSIGLPVFELRECSDVPWALHRVYPKSHTTSFEFETDFDA
jgi:hypothetical protein